MTKKCKIILGCLGLLAAGVAVFYYPKPTAPIKELSAGEQKATANGRVVVEFNPEPSFKQQ